MPDNTATAEVDSSQSTPETSGGSAKAEPAPKPEGDSQLELLRAQLAKAEVDREKLSKNNAALLNEKKQKYKEAEEAAKGEEKYKVLSDLYAKQIQDLEQETSEIATLRATNENHVLMATQTVEMKLSSMPDHVKEVVETMPGWKDADPFDRLQKIEWATANFQDPAKLAKVPGGGQPPGTTSKAGQEYQNALKSGNPLSILEAGRAQKAAIG